VAASKDKARAILSYATPNPVGPYRLITPPTPDLGAGKTKTPILPVIGGTLVNLPTPVMPTKQVTPVAPPLPGRLVNVPKQQGRVVDKSYEDDLLFLQKEYKQSDKVYRNVVGWPGYDDKVKLVDIYRRAKDYIDTTSDPYWKSMYDTTRREREANGEEARDAHQYAVQNVLDTAGFAKDYGVKRAVLSSVNLDNLGDFENIVSDPQSRKAFKKLTETEQENALLLSVGYVGTAQELFDAARSLAK
jgi:hypothetical protein